MAFIPCFSSLGCPERTFSEVLSLADRFHIPLVELRSLESREDIPQLFTEQLKDLAGWDEKVAPFRVRPHILGTSFSLIGNETLAGLEDFIPWAKKVKWLRVFDGGVNGRKLTNEEIAQCGRCLQWTRELLSAHGVEAQVVVETHDAFCDPKEGRRLIDALHGEIQILWDSHHTWRQGGIQTRESWELLGPWVRHIHVKDSRGVKNGAPGAHEYVLPGDGEFNFTELFDLLNQSGYEGAVSLEWEKRWHPELPVIELAIERLLKLGWLAS